MRKGFKPRSSRETMSQVRLGNICGKFSSIFLHRKKVSLKNKSLHGIHTQKNSVSVPLLLTSFRHWETHHQECLILKFDTWVRSKRLQLRFVTRCQKPHCV